eukprot:scaffold247323_cov26-Cyclotella_meneghiniana.AAC.1
MHLYSEGSPQRSNLDHFPCWHTQSPSPTTLNINVLRRKKLKEIVSVDPTMTLIKLWFIDLMERIGAYVPKQLNSKMQANVECSSLLYRLTVVLWLLEKDLVDLGFFHGMIVAVGSPISKLEQTDFGMGHAQVLKFDGTVWRRLGLDLVGLQHEHLFGRCIDLADNGEMVIISASVNSVRAYTWMDSEDCWKQKGGDIINTVRTSVGILEK